MASELDLRTVTKFFFDRAAVTGAVDQGARRTLSRFGAFVRTRARSSIRKRKKVSEPGKPPSSHEGSLRRLILFAYDPAQKSVVAGPVPFRDGLAPRLLEYGGTVTRRGGDGQTRRLVYRPRPFMTPAFEAERPKAQMLFASMIR